MGGIYLWLLLDVLYDLCTATTTAVSHDTPVILGNPVLRSIPGTPDFLAPPTNFCGESMEHLIVALMHYVYDL